MLNIINISDSHQIDNLPTENLVHLNEWINDSGVDKEIAINHLRTIKSHSQWQSTCELFDLLYPTPDRLNAGKLTSENQRLFEKCLQTSGWWVSANNPYVCRIDGIEWGQFKPDDNTPLKETLNGGKYKSPKLDNYSCIFLTPGEKLRHQIAKSNNVDPQLHVPFWEWVLNHSEIPIWITEGAKKSGCLLSNGVVAIALPGITMWQREGELLPELKVLATMGRKFHICFDADPKPQTRIDCFNQSQKLANELDKLGCTVYQVNIPRSPGCKMGIDDFIVGGGKLHQLKTVHWRNSQPPELGLGISRVQGIYLIGRNFSWVAAENLIKDLCGERLQYDRLKMKFIIDGQEVERNSLPLLMEKKFKIRATNKEDFSQLLEAAVSSYSPVQRYLQSIQSQPTEYIDEFIKTSLHIDNPIYIKMVRKWLISAYARGIADERTPVKVDSALILKGTQGLLKSSWLQHLASRQWFCDDMGDINDKDERIKAHKHWIVEWAELETQFGRRQISHIKSFMTSTVDDIRKPYGYSSQEMYRHYVLCGTTNQQEFLPDPTGNRRFWVVPINQIINIKYVIDNRDKLWGAVKAAFESGENWWFDKNEEIKVENETFKSSYRDIDLQEVVVPILCNLVKNGVKTIRSLDLQKAIQNKLDSLETSIKLSLQKLKPFMESLGCGYRQFSNGKDRGKKGYQIRPTSKLMNLISDYGLDIGGGGVADSVAVAEISATATPSATPSATHQTHSQQGDVADVAENIQISKDSAQSINKHSIIENVATEPMHIYKVGDEVVDVVEDEVLIVVKVEPMSPYPDGEYWVENEKFNPYKIRGHFLNKKELIGGEEKFSEK